MPFKHDRLLKLEHALAISRGINVPTSQNVEADYQDFLASLPDDIKNAIKNDILGTTSTYTHKTDLKVMMGSIGLILKNNPQHFNEEEKAKIIYRLREGIELCTPGFHNRVNTILNDLYTVGNTIPILLTRYRNKIVQQAYTETCIKRGVNVVNQIHWYNSFFNIAFNSGYGVLPLNEADAYRIQHPRDVALINHALQNAFATKYKTSNILSYLISYILGEITLKGYKGLITDGTSYPLDVYEGILDFINTFLGKSSGELLDIQSLFKTSNSGDDFTINIVDIDKRVIANELLSTLQTLGIVHDKIAVRSDEDNPQKMTAIAVSFCEHILADAIIDLLNSTNPDAILMDFLIDIGVPQTNKQKIFARLDESRSKDMTILMKAAKSHPDFFKSICRLLDTLKLSMDERLKLFSQRQQKFCEPKDIFTTTISFYAAEHHPELLETIAAFLIDPSLSTEELLKLFIKHYKDKGIELLILACTRPQLLPTLLPLLKSILKIDAVTVARLISVNKPLNRDSIKTLILSIYNNTETLKFILEAFERCAFTRDDFAKLFGARINNKFTPLMLATQHQNNALVIICELFKKQKLTATQIFDIFATKLESGWTALMPIAKSNPEGMQIVCDLFQHANLTNDQIFYLLTQKHTSYGYTPFSMANPKSLQVLFNLFQENSVQLTWEEVFHLFTKSTNKHPSMLIRAISEPKILPIIFDLFQKMKFNDTEISGLFNFQHKNDETIFMFAARKHPQAFLLLCDFIKKDEILRGAIRDRNYTLFKRKNKETGSTMLIEALLEHPELLPSILELFNIANINSVQLSNLLTQQNKNGLTALMCAAVQKNQETMETICKLLEEKRYTAKQVYSMFNKANSVGETTLMFASAYQAKSMLPICRLFQTVGLNAKQLFNLFDKYSVTKNSSLLVAAKSNPKNIQTICNLLAEKHCNANQVFSIFTKEDKNGSTPLIHAALHNLHESLQSICNLFVTAQLNAEQITQLFKHQNRSANTALALAIYHNNQGLPIIHKLFKTIVLTTSQINQLYKITCYKGYTPVLLAVSHPHLFKEICAFFKDIKCTKEEVLSLLEAENEDHISSMNQIARLRPSLLLTLINLFQSLNVNIQLSLQFYIRQHSNHHSFLRSLICNPNISPYILRYFVESLIQVPSSFYTEIHGILTNNDQSGYSLLAISILNNNLQGLKSILNVLEHTSQPPALINFLEQVRPHVERANASTKTFIEAWHQRLLNHATNDAEEPSTTSSSLGFLG